MNNKIILLNSISGCGKDTAADYIVEKYNFTKIAFADGIKEIAKDYFDMRNKDRELLIKIGEKMREINPTVWIDHTLKRSKNINRCIITDCRQEKEYYKAINAGFVPIRILCDKERAIERLIKRDGYCDVNLLELPTEVGTRGLPAINIDNNGLYEDLYRRLDFVMRQDWDNYLVELQYKAKFDQFFNQYS